MPPRGPEWWVDLNEHAQCIQVYDSFGAGQVFIDGAPVELTYRTLEVGLRAVKFVYGGPVPNPFRVVEPFAETARSRLPKFARALVVGNVVEHSNVSRAVIAPMVFDMHAVAHDTEAWDVRLVARDAATPPQPERGARESAEASSDEQEADDEALWGATADALTRLTARINKTVGALRELRDQFDRSA